MDAEEARTVGWALWRVRDARGKSLRVIAGLTGMSKVPLTRIERAYRDMDACRCPRRSHNSDKHPYRGRGLGICASFDAQVRV
jgi:hypothetical protein